MERAAEQGAAGQSTQGAQLPEWVRDVLSLIPPSAVRAVTSNDYNARVSVVLFKEKEELVMDALKNHGAGAKKRSKDGKGTGTNRSRQYGSVDDCPELRHGRSNAFPPIESHLRIICSKSNMHVGHKPKRKRDTHIVSSSECQFKCVIRFFKDRTDLFLLCFESGCHKHSCSENDEGGIVFDLGDKEAVAKGAKLAEVVKEDVDERAELEERLRAKQIADWNVLRCGIRDGLEKSGDGGYRAIAILYFSPIRALRPRA